ncbi:histidine--tRNA ligase [Rhodoluna sp.]|uniref:histidine--tRNA ligase n=1 Tax=Rhodoluna sp. TaxID=1969481 RepID=UPI0025DB67E1|nr:histidine--tRNA ligase [Rhodoluna sp.]
MAKDVHPPRGMRDFLPVEKNRRDQVLTKIRETYLGHGFQEIETPALEDLARLTSGQGGDNEKLAFRVMKRGAELEAALAASDGEDNLADLGLRYDLTVPLTRYYATNRTKLPAVFKALQTGPVWRAERPQKGRYRQFVQCDIDIIGDASILAEIELLNASLDALAAIGLNDASIRVNHRVLLANLLEQLGVPEAGKGSAMITIDKLDKIAAEGVVAELAEKFDAAVAERAAAWLNAIAGDLPIPAELNEIFAAVEARHGKGRLRFDPTLVRGMGYYTGTIFEIEHPESGSSIGGGGRYDGMVGRWLGTDAPAVGISIGFERAVDLVEVSPDNAKSLVLILDSTDSAVIGNALNLQQEAIAAGYRVRLEQRPKKLNMLLGSMAEQGFGSFASVGVDAISFGDLALRQIG